MKDGWTAKCKNDKKGQGNKNQQRSPRTPKKLGIYIGVVLEHQSHLYAPRYLTSN